MSAGFEQRNEAVEKKKEAGGSRLPKLYLSQTTTFQPGVMLLFAGVVVHKSVVNPPPFCFFVPSIFFTEAGPCEEAEPGQAKAKKQNQAKGK